jgi:hypothetical protein
VTQEIQSLLKQPGMQPSDIAVLYRQNYMVCEEH